MENSDSLVRKMAEECRFRIRESIRRDPGLPPPLQAGHLEWMCDILLLNVKDWPGEKLHRWIGFVQCGMLANRMLDLDEAKVMFNPAKAANQEGHRDLLDHLDPECSFELEIGGEG